MDTRKTYDTPSLLELGDVTTVTMGTWEMGEEDPITKLRVDPDI